MGTTSSFLLNLFLSLFLVSYLNEFFMLLKYNLSH